MIPALLTTLTRIPASTAAPPLARPRREPRIRTRAPFEFYPTPPEATRALLAAETFDGTIWEPACGNGAIAKELIRFGYDVTSTDIADWGWGDPGYDFLSLAKPLAKHIVTNPPYGYGLADRFVSHALHLTAGTGGKVAMLLNITSLCHPKRFRQFSDWPPSVIYALDDCICWPCGDPSQATRFTRQHRYAWVIWDNEHMRSGIHQTAFRWLTTSPYRNAQQQGEKS